MVPSPQSFTIRVGHIVLMLPKYYVSLIIPIFQFQKESGQPQPTTLVSLVVLCAAIIVLMV